jgi:hypothetical protein
MHTGKAMKTARWLQTTHLNVSPACTLCMAADHVPLPIERTWNVSVPVFSLQVAHNS